MEEKGKLRLTIRLKTIMLIVIFGLVLASVAMVYFTYVTSQNNRNTYKSLATDLSNTVALSLDKTKVKNIAGMAKSYYDSYAEKPTREKEGTPEYNEYMAKYDELRATQDYKDIQQYLLNVRNLNQDTDGVYLGMVDYDLKLVIYLVYDEENEYYPTGIIDPLYEEDYPIVDNPKLGFVASIYQAEIEGVYLVTAGAPVLDENGDVICYALVDITMETVTNKFNESIIKMFIYLLISVVIISAIGIVVVYFMLVRPVRALQNAAKSYDINDPVKTHIIFSNLEVNVNDELADLAENMKKMENDINDKINELTEKNEELIASQQVAEKMTKLANADALTGVGNKVAYDEEARVINEQISNNEEIEFGIAMVDLNDLKVINDNFGHENGDIALRNLAVIINNIFANSSIYRVGGDEFVVIVRGEDYHNSNRLIKQFNRRIDKLAKDEDLNLAEKTSAAIGYAEYDPKIDKCVDDVFRRADEAMYIRKREMKNEGDINR